jgi:hypothetical protein
MERILLTKDLAARGYAANEIETMVRAGELISCAAARTSPVRCPIRRQNGYNIGD